MSGFNQDDGFFQSGYYDNQQAQAPQYGDYSGQQFGQEQQFGQFDYNQQGYDYSQGGQVYGGDQYTGSIMTPAAPYTSPQDTREGKLRR